MTNQTFQFSPRVSLIMANLKIIREIRKVFKEKGGEGQTEVKRFMRHIKDNLKDKIFALRSWELDIEENSICVYPNDRWKVTDDNYISIAVDFSRGITPHRLEGDPWVGLYVPYKWPQRQLFNKKLLSALSEDFRSRWDEPEDEWPIWTWVPYEDYLKRDIFDIRAFIENVTELVSKLVEKKDTIDNILKQIKKT